MRRRTKWLIALAVLLPVGAVGVALAWVASVLYAFTQPIETEMRPASCATAMKSIGWQLPARADHEDCTEIASSVFASGWTGEFRMNRSEARTWLTGLPGTQAHLDERDALHLGIVPPSNGRIDQVEVDVRWDGEDAVVAFKTYNG